MRYSFIIPILFWALTACTRELELDVSEAPQVVVNSIFHTTDTLPVVKVRLTGSPASVPVTDAVVTMRVNGGKSLPIDSFSRPDQYRPTSLLGQINPGDEVSIDVQTSQYHATSSSRVPYPVIIEGVDTCTVRIPLSANVDMLYPCRRLHVHLAMPPQAEGEQYYRVEVSRVVKYLKSWSFDGSNYDYQFDSLAYVGFLYSYDTALHVGYQVPQENLSDGWDLFDNGENYCATFRSSHFTDGRYTLKLDLLQYSLPYLQEEDIRIRLFSLTRMEYDYLCSLSAFVDFEPGIVTNSEPVFPSNIQGGTGIFGVEAMSEYNLHIGEPNLPHY